MKKILIIDSCFRCPNYVEYGGEADCMELSRRLKSPSGRIPKDCPLEDHYEDRNS